MPLLNYSTKVTPSKSIADIQDALRKAGATTVATLYDQGEVSGLQFTVPTAFGERAFMLPANTDRVKEVLQRQARYEKLSRAQRDDLQKALKKPEWVAWRVLKDWIEAQLALIQTQMVTLDQIMLPYMQADEHGRTVYEVMVARHLALPAGEND